MGTPTQSILRHQCEEWLAIRINHRQIPIHQTPIGDLIDEFESEETTIGQIITDDKVKYSLVGSLGDKINNPDIILEFTDVFNNDSKPSISELNNTFIKLYVTLYLLSKSKDE